MVARSFASVGQFRRSLLTSAAMHPFNAVPLSGIAIVLLVSGLALAALALLFLDVVAVVVALRLKPVRRRLRLRADDRARQRAAERLGSAAQAEWHSLRAMVRRAEQLNPCTRELEALLDTYLNVALAHHHARECVEATASERVPSDDGPLGRVLRERAAANRRTERALAAMREQLDVTSQRIRLACDLAVAARCESGAELWLADVHDGVPLLE